MFLISGAQLGDLVGRDNYVRCNLKTEYYMKIKLLFFIFIAILFVGGCGSGYFITSVQKGDHDAVIEALKKEKDQNQKNWALRISSQKGYYDITKLLIEEGANINDKSDRGFPPLSLAAGNNHLKIVELLVESGAKINFENDENDKPIWTPLVAAVLNPNSTQIVSYLLKKGANINGISTINLWGEFVHFTPLTMAAKENNETIFKLLLNAGASPPGDKGLLIAGEEPGLYNQNMISTIETVDGETCNNKFLIELSPGSHSIIVKAGIRLYGSGTKGPDTITISAGEILVIRPYLENKTGTQMWGYTLKKF